MKLSVSLGRKRTTRPPLRPIQTIGRTFLAGAAVCIPVVITAWIIVALGLWLNGLAMNAAQAWTPLAEVLGRVPGLGVLMVLALVYLVGLATRFWVFARVFALLDRLLDHVPLVKTVYGSVRDMMRFFGGAEGTTMGKVVLYRVPGQDVKMLALLTNEHPVGLPADQAVGRVAIWLPMSYQLGGYMLYVPAAAVEPIDMSVEQLMKLAATAEIGAVSAPPLPRTAPPPK